MSISESASQPATRISAATPAESAPSVWSWAALAVALIALAGSLYLSLGMGKKACPLCFYQRTFAMSLVAVLGVGLLTTAGRTARLGLLALPLATAGLGVALFHVSLEVRGKLECPQGLFGWGTAPEQSLALFAVLLVLLSVDVLGKPQAGAGPAPAWVGVLILGSLLAVGACTSNPPMPAPPREAYPTRVPDICRPPALAGVGAQT